MTAIDVQGTSVSDVALALWAENSAISLKLFRTLKQRHQSLPHFAKHSRFPLSPWLTTISQLQDHLHSGHTMEQQTSESLLPRCPRPAS